MSLQTNLLSLPLSLALGLCLAGCGRSDNGSKQAAPEGDAASSSAHDPDDVPITEADVKMPANYSEAIERVKSYRDTIRDAVVAGTPTKAHRALDELDIVLNKLPTIAKDSGVPKDQWETVNTSAQELRNLFNQVHSAIDEKREPDYKAVEEQIDQAIARLEAIEKK